MCYLWVILRYGLKNQRNVFVYLDFGIMLRKAKPVPDFFFSPLTFSSNYLNVFTILDSKRISKEFIFSWNVLDSPAEIKIYTKQLTNYLIIPLNHSSFQQLCEMPSRYEEKLALFCSGDWRTVFTYSSVSEVDGGLADSGPRD